MKDNVLYRGFLASAERVPDRAALHVNGSTLTYAQLRNAAASVAATLQERVVAHSSGLTAVFAERSRVGFAGILGALLAGHGYVPLNVTFPIAQTRRMLQRASCRSLIVDAEAEAQLDAVLADIDASLLIILPERQSVRALQARWRQHVFVGAHDLAEATAWVDRSPAATDVAYLLFTSGSTGVPKGIGVTHANVTHFVQAMVERYGIVREDRFSQMFDTTFDLSVFDMFVAWQQGACVYCPTRATLLNPDRFIRDHELTVWFSVPTVGLLMKRLGSLKPGRYPSLRWSLFCGEPLPMDLAQAWTAAAPGTALENLYGPTELTVACTAYRWDSDQSPRECSGGVVPIGMPLPGMRARVMDERLADVDAGQVGELLMGGPQRAPGYWLDPEATERAFVGVPGEDEVFYRTGDLVRKPADDGPISYVGRVDHQIKVLGHRVELEEVESLLRQEPGVHQAVAIGWPPTSTGMAGVAAFVTGSDIDVAALRTRIRQKLQSYAVPQTICVLSAFPQNASGKVDRQALLGLLSA